MSGLIQFFQTNPGSFAVACGLLGLMVGSFLNVVIHRLPKVLERDWLAQCAELRGETVPEAPPYNLVSPRSGCPHCGHRITALENIPVLSYLVLKGRCSGCGKPISLRYPIVETLGGALSAYAAWRFGFGAAAAGALIFLWTMIALTFIDVDTQLLPDNITLPLLWVGLAFNLGGVFTDLTSAVIGAMAGYVVLWTIYWAFKLATGKEGMGYGDFKLLAAIGAWLGWKLLPVVILLSSVVGAAVGIVLIVAARHGRNVPIPFGPYLAGGGVIALFWGQALTRAYLGTH
jgi:leader peptidase (prepilin peptidase)/N-methyltransferase